MAHVHRIMPHAIAAHPQPDSMGSTPTLVTLWVAAVWTAGVACGGSSRTEPDAGPLPEPSCTSLGGEVVSATPTISATLLGAGGEGWLASPAVADLDNDGTPETVAAREDGVWVWHANGDVVFSHATEGRIWASPVVADLDADTPGLELAVASRDKIYMWNASGTAMDGFPVTWRDEMRSLAAGDIDGDSDLELVAVTSSPLEANGQRDILIALHHDGSLVEGFPPNTSGAAGCDDACYVTGGYDQNIGLANIDDDAALEIFASQDNAYISVHDGDGRAFDAASIFDDRAKVLGVRFLHDYALAQQGWADDEDAALQAHFTNSAPTFADVDGDGANELVVLASVQNAAQSDRERGVALWAVRPDGTRPSAWLTPFHAPEFIAGLWDFEGTNIVGATNQVSVATIAPALPTPQFVFAGFDGRIHVVDAEAHEVWSRIYTNDDNVLTAGVAVGDLSGDGRPEVVFATYSTETEKSHLFVLDAAGAQQHKVALPGRGSMAVPTLADASGDGRPDIVVALKDAGPGEVLVFSVASADDNCLLWPTGRKNLKRNAGE